jgi:hypothetical protein
MPVSVISVNSAQDEDLLMGGPWFEHGTCWV